MGSVYKAQEKYEVAELTYCLTLDILTETYGEDHPHVLLAKKRLEELPDRRGEQ